MLRKIFIYTLAFLIPPFLAGVIMFMAMIRDLMVSETPEAIPNFTPSAISSPTNDRPLALVVLAKDGTQLSELMISYEALARSQALNVFTVAETLDLLPTTAALDIYPDLLFEKAPQPDLIVLPALVNRKDPKVIAWLRKVAPQAKAILTLGEGAQTLAEAGLLHGKPALTHFLALEDMRRYYPNTQWAADRRFLIEGPIVTSSGITASLDASLETIQKFYYASRSKGVAQEVGYPFYPFTPKGVHPSKLPHTPKPLTKLDQLQLFLRAAFDWNRKNIGVFLYEGMSEMSLAAAMDVFPRSLSLRTVSMSERRKVIDTRHGMRVVPKVSLETTPWLDLLVIPSGVNSKEKPLLRYPSVEAWIRAHSIPVKSYQNAPPAMSYRETLKTMARLTGLRLTRIVAKMINYPFKDFFEEDMELPEDLPHPPSWPWHILIRPFLLGVLGMLVLRLALKKLRY